MEYLEALLLAIVLGQLQGALALARADQLGTDLLLLRWGEEWRQNEGPRTDQLRERHQLCQHHLPLLLLPLHCLSLLPFASAIHARQLPSGSSVETCHMEQLTCLIIAMPDSITWHEACIAFYRST